MWLAHVIFSVPLSVCVSPLSCSSSSSSLLSRTRLVMLLMLTIPMFPTGIQCLLMSCNLNNYFCPGWYFASSQSQRTDSAEKGTADRDQYLHRTQLSTSFLVQCKTSFCFSVLKDASDDAPSQRDFTCATASVATKGR